MPRWLKIVGVALAALVVVVSVAVATLNRRARKSVKRELAIIRARGEPTTIEELAPAPIPDEENAAIPLQKAFAALDAAAGEERERGLRRWEDCLQEPFGPHREKVVGALELYSDAMRLARAALTRPHCTFELEYEDGYSMEMPHLAKLRRLTRLFAAEALLHAEDGRAEEAAANLRNAFRLARTLECEPILISQLVLLGNSGIGLGALRDIGVADLSDETLHRLIADLEAFDMATVATRGMIGERVFQAHTISQLIRGDLDLEGVGSNPSGKKKLTLPRLIKLSFLRDEATLLAVMTRAVDVSRLPPWEALREMESVGAEVVANPRRFGIMVGLLLPATARVQNRVVRSWARRDAAVLALLLELHKSAHGEYPVSLDALVPEFLPKLPPDPFTGEPFVYRRRADGQGFVVYSVGVNLKDDGGVKDEKSGKDDISWERAPASRRE